MNKTYDKNNKRIISFIAMALAIVFALSFNLRQLSIKPSYASTSIADLNGKQDEIEQKLAQIKKQKNLLKDKTKELSGELSWLNSKTKEERNKYEELVEDLNNAYTQMDIALEEASAAEKILDKKQKQNKERLQVMFENRNKSSLEMLFDASDVNGFIANIRLISIIAENDKNIITELDSAKSQALIKREAAEDYYKEIELFVAQKEKEINKLKKNIYSAQNELSEKKQELSQAEKDEDALLLESKKINAEIKKLQSKGAYYGGTMVWPAPGYTGINPGNGFGMRLHPIYKYWRMHNGVDINAPFDAKLVAAADGKVILVKKISGYDPVNGNNRGGSGYGNYISIDHGGGISTLYAHCKLIKVGVGDNVKAGQWIAIAGSTGLSTGAHLHFEVRENGSPVNPIQSKYLGVKK